MTQSIGERSQRHPGMLAEAGDGHSQAREQALDLVLQETEFSPDSVRRHQDDVCHASYLGLVSHR